MHARPPRRPDPVGRLLHPASDRLSPAPHPAVPGYRPCLSRPGRPPAVPDSCCRPTHRVRRPGRSPGLRCRPGPYDRRPLSTRPARPRRAPRPGRSPALLPASGKPRPRRVRPPRPRRPYGAQGGASGKKTNRFQDFGASLPSPSVRIGLSTFIKRAARTWRGAGGSNECVRRFPTLPGVCTPSTIGAGGLNFRVRNGNGWIPAAIATEQHLIVGRSLESSIASMKA